MSRASSLPSQASLAPSDTTTHRYGPASLPVVDFEDPATGAAVETTRSLDAVPFGPAATPTVGRAQSALRDRGPGGGVTLTGGPAGRDNKSAAELLALPALAGATADEQTRWSKLYASLPNAGARQSLGALIGRQVNGSSPAQQTGVGGESLLTVLERLLWAPVVREADGIDRGRFVTSALAEAVDPGQVSQGNYSTCGAACVQYLLCRSAPVEYLRLQADLISDPAGATMRDGSRLRLVRDSDGEDPAGAVQGYEARSQSEALFQTAVMDHFDTGGVGSYTRDGDLQHDGLAADEIARAATVFLGRPYKATNLVTAGKDDKRRALAAAQAGEAILGLRWRSGAHVVVSLGERAGRLDLHNPAGPTKRAQGSRLGGSGEDPGTPPRRIEDPRTGKQSMELGEAASRLWDLIAPE